MARRLRFDLLLLATVLGLCLFGLVMLYSASAVIAHSRLGLSPFFFVSRQIQALVAGLVLAGIAMSVDYRRWRNPWLLAIGLGLAALSLVAVLFTPKINNTHRWLDLGAISFQPSELAKLPLIVFLAHWLDRRREQLDDLTGSVLPAAAVVGGLTVLILLEPDFGTSMVVLAVALTLFFLAGLPLRYFVITAAALLPASFLAVATSAYRMRRVLAFLHPESDPLGIGFQASQSLIAHGSGGILGAGLGNGRQKLFFLPEPHTDFIYSIVGEELGLVGSIFLLATFGFFFWRALRAARSAPDRFGFYLAAGIGAMVLLQVLIHVSVTLALLPTKGLPLPFISYGRTFLVSCLVGSGILLNISQHGD